MPKLKLIRSTVHPYHVYGRVNNREHFPTYLQAVWTIFSKNLLIAQEKHGAKVHAFVLMPNHYHIILSTPDKDLGIVMRDLVRSVTKTINYISGRSGRVFGGKYHGLLVTSDGHFDYLLKYLYRNPVVSKLCEHPQNYRYSSLNAAIGNEELHFKLDLLPGQELLIPNNDIAGFLEWLSIPFQNEDEEKIRKALRGSAYLQIRDPKIFNKNGPKNF